MTVADPAVGTGSVKLLVVEDDVEVAKAINRRKLRADGMEVEVSIEPQASTAKLEAGLADWDVVLLDVGLPEHERHRRCSIGSARPAPMSSVIMLTGDRQREHRRGVHARGRVPLPDQAVPAVRAVDDGAVRGALLAAAPPARQRARASATADSMLIGDVGRRCASCAPRSSASPIRTCRS